MVTLWLSKNACIAVKRSRTGNLKTLDSQRWSEFEGDQETVAVKEFLTLVPNLVC